jgi:PIN domain nuclease of toxin-antitoxin system
VSELLDTHILLWWFEDGKRLSRAQTRLVRRRDPKRPLLVSDISLWEIATLVSLGRVRLRLPLRDWLERATAPPLVRRVGISPAIAAELALLPDDLHRDPADRLLLATARVLGARLVTQDRRLASAGIVEILS